MSGENIGTSASEVSSQGMIHLYIDTYLLYVNVTTPSKIYFESQLCSSRDTIDPREKSTRERLAEKKNRNNYSAPPHPHKMEWIVPK